MVRNESRPAMPLTLDEHRELGVEMRSLRARLGELSVLMGSVYGDAHGAAAEFQAAAAALERLQARLEEQAAEDMPGRNIAGVYR